LRTVEKTVEGKRHGRIENLRPWKPGQSGNPGGRPRKRLIDRELEELLSDSDSSLANAIARALLVRARKGDLKAIQLVVERTEGRPRQAVEVSGPDGNRIALEFMSDEQLNERIAQLQAQLAGGKE
jgi:hypothetical protein